MSMRIVFIGAGSLSVRTARLLIERGHEVVIVERNPEVIEALSDELDCGLLHADGTRPQALREVDPAHSDLLLCLTGNDQTNIIASLVGRSLGFDRVITRIEDEEFEHICLELGLQDTIIPARTIGRHLADIAEGNDILELSAAIRGDARVFLLVVGEEEVSRVGELDLPEGARASHLYRDGELVFAEPDTPLRRGDEVVIIAHRDTVEALRERWNGSRGRQAPAR